MGDARNLTRFSKSQIGTRHWNFQLGIPDLKNEKIGVLLGIENLEILSSSKTSN